MLICLRRVFIVLAVLLLNFASHNCKIIFETGSKYEGEHKENNNYEQIQKPIKFDTAASNPASMSAPPLHPYNFQDASGPLDTYPYAPSVTPAYTPPLLQPFNSKVDPVGSDHGLNILHDPAPWKKLVRLFIAAIPIGLFLAALPPNIVHINSSTPVTKPFGVGQQRQRSETEGGLTTIQTFPILDMIEKMGGLSVLEEPGCEARIFCEMSRLGSTKGSNSVQRFLWSTATETPDAIAELLGVRPLLKAIRTNECSIFKCSASDLSHSTRRETAKV